jgi:hypothetical protein
MQHVCKESELESKFLNSRVVTYIDFAIIIIDAVN